MPLLLLERAEDEVAVLVERGLVERTDEVALLVELGLVEVLASDLWVLDGWSWVSVGLSSS